MWTTVYLLTAYPFIPDSLTECLHPSNQMLKRAGFQFEVDVADVAAIQQSGMRCCWSDLEGLDPSSYFILIHPKTKQGKLRVEYQRYFFRHVSR